MANENRTEFEFRDKYEGIGWHQCITASERYFSIIESVSMTTLVSVILQLKYARYAPLTRTIIMYAYFVNEP